MLRALAIIALVLLILLLVIPLGMGMAMMGGCPECTSPGASAGVGMCIALLASLMIVALGFRELAHASSVPRAHSSWPARSNDLRSASRSPSTPDPRR